MNKKGAEGFLWLKVFYFILALIIVILLYGFLSGKLSSIIFLGYASREIGMNIDAVKIFDDGDVKITEEFKEPLYLEIKDSKVNVRSAANNRSLEYDFFDGDNEVEYSSGDKAYKKFVIEKNEGGVEINGR
ncbi:MAG TPA: hypothetical protein VJJ21_00595 [Candidatus Nanoarchaeia archaeon]|nr:hypothetical protein [Candidatus Nanoarchaeia archaeon]